jgi:cytoskeleton protein RodZ
MPRPECPRCRSALVVPALAGIPSEYVLELRGGDEVPVGARRETFEEWLCRSCGNHWPREDSTAESARTGSVGSESSGEAPELSGPAPELAELERLLAGSGASIEDLDAPGPRLDTKPSGLGATLRRGREERSLSLAQAAASTGIWERHLQALENDAPLDEFPAPAYARFFLREYAEFLGLDPVAVLREFDRLHPPPEESPLEPLPDPRRHWRIAGTALTVLTLVALVALAVVGNARSRTRAGLPIEALRSHPPAAPASPVVSSRRSVVVPHGPAGRRGSAITSTGVRAQIHLLQPCWVQAIADGRVLAQQTLQPGASVTYRADHELRLVLGNAGGVALRVNGMPVVTGGPGQVVRLDIRWRQGRAVVARA